MTARCMRFLIVFGSVALVIWGAVIAVSVAAWAWKALPSECTPPPKGTTEILREKTDACAASCKAAGQAIKSFTDATAWEVGTCECQPCRSSNEGTQ